MLVGDNVGAPRVLEAWNWLKRIEGQDTEDLDVSELAGARMWQGYRLPDDADAYVIQEYGRVALSTVHAAKGREFDRVVLLQPERITSVGLEGSPLEEARVLYVAATRARRELARLGRQGLPDMWRARFGDDERRRWMALDPKSRKCFIEIGLGEM